MTNDRVQGFSDLVEGAKSGDRGCLEKLVSLLHKEVFQMVYFRTGSRMDAEDLTQEIFIRMSKNIGRLKDPSAFKAWLYRIALNRVRDFHRKKSLLSLLSIAKAGESIEPSVGIHNPLDQVMEKEFWDQFYHLTRKMSKIEQDVFTLRYLDQLGIREIAETLRKNESTIKTNLYRALKKFKLAHGLRFLLERSL